MSFLHICPSTLEGAKTSKDLLSCEGYKETHYQGRIFSTITKKTL